MATHSRVPIAFGSGGTGTEEGRAFFQSRLTLFGCWVFLISGGFLLVGVALNAVFQTPFNSGMVFHLAGVLVAGAMWGIGRYPRLTVSAARAVDAIGTLLLGTSFSLMAAGFAVTRDALATDPMHALFAAIALPRRGIRTSVFERDTHPKIAPRFNPDRSCTIDISGHGLKALREALIPGRGATESGCI